MSPTRREFLRHCLASSAIAAAGCNTLQSTRPIPGEFAGPSFRDAHRLRRADFPEPSEEQKTRVLIIGGGIAGLCAARNLQRQHVGDIILCELEREAGGNSSFGQNEVSSYPWGAHYIPVPNQESTLVHELFAELGIISGSSGKPKYREEFLCHEPEDRLLMHGRWQNGVIPKLGLSADERRQMREFFSEMNRLRAAVGADGKPAFAIPLDLSSQDEEFRKLDGLSFAAYLDSRQWTSAPLRWYTNYCCRDDYGTEEQDLSAWAGIHYFAARRPYAANASGYQLLTWPEGNGWIVRQIRESLSGIVRRRSLVYSLSQNEHEVVAKILDLNTNRSYRVRAELAIYAAPRFTLPYLEPGIRNNPPAYLTELHYAPWAVANVTIRNFRDVSSFAWDNVSYHSSSLGYVVATHQRLERQGPNTVLTWYQPLSKGEPKKEREAALARTLSDWQTMVVNDLRRMHPGIEQSISNIDVCLWGHAMIRPARGFIWGQARHAMLQPLGRIHFAHSDMSGISIFEEAQYRGHLAAEQVASLIRA